MKILLDNNENSFDRNAFKAIKQRTDTEAYHWSRLLVICQRRSLGSSSSY